MKEKKYKRLRDRLMFSLIVPLLCILLILGIFIQKQMQTSINALKNNEIESQTLSATSAIEDYFECFFTASAIVTDVDVVKNIMQDAMVNGTGFRIETDDRYPEILSLLKNINTTLGSSVQAVWLGVIGNEQILASTGYCSDDTLRVTDRPWFKEFVANNCYPLVTSAYVDAETGNIVVSTILGVKQDNNVIGVVGIDIALDEVSVVLNNYTIGDNGYIIAFDSNGNVVHHKNDEYLMKNLKDLQFDETVLNALIIGENSPTMNYTCEEIKYHGAIGHAAMLSWNILGVMEEEEFTEELSSMRKVIILGFMTCVLCIASLCWFISLSVTKPIKSLSDIALQLASGELDVDINIKSKDEVGKLADCIEQLILRLKDYVIYIDEITQILTEVSRGNLKFNLTQEYVGEFSKIRDAMLEIKRSLSNVFSEIVTAAEEVDVGAQQISNASQMLAQGTTEQASTVEQIAATINELSAQTNSGASNADVLKDKFIDINTKLNQNDIHMREMVDAMDNITKKSAEINKIVKAIEDIAFQTNILALNASVEAARAGMSGKGFAVVADEVRNLAGKTDAEAKNVVSLIQQSIEAVKAGSGIATSTAEELNEIAGTMAKAVGTMQDFADTYKQQAYTLGQVSTGVEEISTVVQSNSATAEQTAASSQELTAQSKMLYGLTERFTFD